MHFALFLLPVSLAASFTSRTDDKADQPVVKLDFAQLQPRENLIQELSKIEGIPDLTNDTLANWVENVVSNHLSVSENVARWVMLEHFHGKSHPSSQYFFYYIMDNFGYVSLVKDLVDYDDCNQNLIVQYLLKHRLRHFTQLPKSLRDAMAQLDSSHLATIYQYLGPLLSDYTINHRKILTKVLLFASDLFPVPFSIICLVCHCLGSADLKMHYIRPSMAELVFISKMAKEFPERMSDIMAGLSVADKMFIEIYCSNEPPKLDWWTEQVSKVNQTDTSEHMRSVYFNKLAHLFRDFIHHLFLTQREWISVHIFDLNDVSRTAYFLSYPEDIFPKAFPDEMPLSHLIVPSRVSPRFIPFYQMFIAKYGLENLMKAVEQCLEDSLNSSWNLQAYDGKNLAKMVKITNNSKLQGQSFNRFIYTLYYMLGPDHFNDEFVAWFYNLLRTTDPTIWAKLILDHQ